MDEWLPYEIHPDTPPEGVLWKDYFPGMNPEAFFRKLDQRGKKRGNRFGSQPLMSNSRAALEAGEYAKEKGSYEPYHQAIFRAFFSDCQDIGKREVILQAAAQAGLDRDELAAALDAKTYLPRLQMATQSARQQGISGVPGFVIPGHGLISGAQPYESFRRIFARLQENNAA